MLVRADEINYDYTNERVSAVGNVQIYFGASTLEADRVIYDQNTKRLHAEGNVRLTQADGKVTHGEIMDLSDDYRDGFVDSLRLDAPEQTRLAAARAERSGGNFTIFHSGVYTACEPCKDDPKKPPLWQVKAARIIHDRRREDDVFRGRAARILRRPARLLPVLLGARSDGKAQVRLTHAVVSARARSTGSESRFPITGRSRPTTTSPSRPRSRPSRARCCKASCASGCSTAPIRPRHGPLPARQGLSRFGEPTPGYRDWRGSVETSGQFNLTDKWVWGWDATVVTDKNFLQDYGLMRNVATTNLAFGHP